MLTGRYVSVTDKLQFLWCLCLIEHYNEIDKKVTWQNIEDEFGYDVVRMFNAFREMATIKHLVKYNSHQLTPKGQAIVSEWKYHRDRVIMSVT